MRSRTGILDTERSGHSDGRSSSGAPGRTTRTQQLPRPAARTITPLTTSHAIEPNGGIALPALDPFGVHLLGGDAHEVAAQGLAGGGTELHPREALPSFVPSSGVIQARKRLSGPAEPEGFEVPSGSGSALPAPLRENMERSFGADFSDVRVHQGDAASRAGAVAFASGSDLHFAPGQYAPSSSGGQELIAHELAHVVQQRAGRVSAPQGKGAPVNEDPALEAEADTLAARAVRGEVVGSGGGAAVGAAVKQLKKQVSSSSNGKVKWSDKWNTWWVMIGSGEEHVSIFPIAGTHSDSSKKPALTDIWYDEFHVTISGQHFFFNEDGEFQSGGSPSFGHIFRGQKICTKNAQLLATAFVEGRFEVQTEGRFGVQTNDKNLGGGSSSGSSSSRFDTDHRKDDLEEWGKARQKYHRNNNNAEKQGEKNKQGEKGKDREPNGGGSMSKKRTAKSAWGGMGVTIIPNKEKNPGRNEKISPPGATKPPETLGLVDYESDGEPEKHLDKRKKPDDDDESGDNNTTATGGSLVDY